MKLTDDIRVSIKFMYIHIEDEKLNLADIAKSAGHSVEYFSRKFKNQIGMSVMYCFKIMKMFIAVDDLLNGHTVLDVAYKYGYSKDGFTKAFKNVFGVAPIYVKKNKCDIRKQTEGKRWERILFWILL